MHRGKQQKAPVF